MIFKYSPHMVSNRIGKGKIQKESIAFFEINQDLNFLGKDIVSG